MCLFGKEILQTQALPILSTAWPDKKDEAAFRISWQSLGAIFGRHPILTTQRLKQTI